MNGHPLGESRRRSVTPCLLVVHVVMVLEFGPFFCFILFYPSRQRERVLYEKLPSKKIFFSDDCVALNVLLWYRAPTVLLSPLSSLY